MRVAFLALPSPAAANTSVSSGSLAWLLDSGPGIDPASLALSGPFLYWLKDGLPQAATLS